MLVVSAVIVIAIIIGVIVAAATGSKNASAPTAPVVHKCSFYPDTKKKPQTCISSGVEGLPCYDYAPTQKPRDCLSVAQFAVQTKAQKRADAQARVAAKRAAVRARAAAKRAAAQAKAVAKRAAAARAAANAWHKGYFEQNYNVFWKWSNGGGCADYAQQYGCWHVVVITRNGCPSYVAVNANEYQGKSIVGQLLDNQGYGIPAKTPRRFELDADTGNVTANNVSIDCE